MLIAVVTKVLTWICSPQYLEEAYQKLDHQVNSSIGFVEVLKLSF